MKLLHLADLHLGKRVNEFSMLEDQKVVLREILEIVDEEKTDGVLIAGDVFDKSVPSEEALKEWEIFLLGLVKRGQQVFVIGGNHDSAVRLSVHNKLIEAAGIHISSEYNGEVAGYTFQDAYGPWHVFLLPFVKPAHVRAIYPEETIENYTDAIRVALSKTELRKEERNIILAHQFVIGAQKCDSEEINIGGLDSVDGGVFDDFDYVALGHIHGPQKVGKDTVRYSGTPLKYSFSEVSHKKSVTLLEMREKDDIRISLRELHPPHDMRLIRGTFEEVMHPDEAQMSSCEDYVHIVLTDEEDVYEAMARLRVIYPNVMKLSYDNARTRENHEITVDEKIHQKTPMQLFEQLYELQNNCEMSEKQKAFVTELMGRIWKE